KSILPVMSVQGNAIKAAGGIKIIQKISANSVRQNATARLIMLVARRAVLPTASAASHRFRQTRHWKEWPPRRRCAAQALLLQQSHRHRQAPAPAFLLA